MTHTSDPADASPFDLYLNAFPMAVKIRPRLTALAIVDLQNYFLSPGLGRPEVSPGLLLAHDLATRIIPACRNMGMHILWINWRVSPDDIEKMPPNLQRAFLVDDNFVHRDRIPQPGLGQDILGGVTLDGTVLENGKVLMANDLSCEPTPLLAKSMRNEDSIIWKNRTSAFSGLNDMHDVLRARGIRTLIFTGYNAFQGVESTLRDASARGYDCLLLKQGAVSNWENVRDCFELNCSMHFGFVILGEQLVAASHALGSARQDSVVQVEGSESY